MIEPQGLHYPVISCLINVNTSFMTVAIVAPPIVNGQGAQGLIQAERDFWR